MKKIIAVLCLALFAMPVLAATQQQERTKACNAAATKKGLKADKHKAYVKACVSAKAKTKSNTASAPKKSARPATAATPAVPAPKTGPAQPTAASAATPATPATPAVPSANAANDKKRIRCDEIARQSNVSPARNREFMDKCMAG